MRLVNLLGPDLDAALQGDPAQLTEALSEFHHEDIAELLNDLPEEQAIRVVRLLPNEQAADVLSRMGDDDQERLLQRIGTDEAALLLRDMSPDDRADALQELPEDVAEQVLSRIEEIEPEVAEKTRELVSFPEDTAGGLMTTEYIALAPETKVWEAIDAVRERSREGAETVYYIYVVAFGNRLVGVVSLRDLILGDSGVTIEHVMTDNIVQVTPLTDQEEVAGTIAKYDISALPVVDDQHRMLGLVTVDDIVDVVVEEATEDAQLMGAVQPIEDPYFDTTFWTFIQKRLPWLLILFGAGLGTTYVMELYETELEKIASLVLFVPLIISSGGNSGSQSSSLIIRALAVGELTPRDWWRVFCRELAVGVVLGCVLGLLGLARGLMVESDEPMRVGFAVCTSIIAVVVTGTVIGSVLPLLIKRLGFDPAVSSTPFIASVVDLIGLAVYFSAAQVFFHHILSATG